MGDAKHTPGPWRVEAGTTVIWSDNAYDAGANNVGCIVARAAQPQTWKACRPTADEQVHNACLIAAAPEMLGALKGLVGALDGRVHSSPALRALSDARAAIAKAEGR